MKLRALTSALIAISLSGCGDAQVDSDYLGESIFSVSGTITVAQPESAHGKHEATLIWLNQHREPGEPGIVSTKAPVKGNFPASFRLDVYTPPPANIFTDFSNGGMLPNESRIAFGYIATVKAGTTTPVPEDPNGGVTGLAEDFMLIYAEKDIKPGTYGAKMLHGTLSKGFHLMKVVQPCFSLKGESCMRTNCPGDPVACFEQCETDADAICATECAGYSGGDPEKDAYCKRGKDALFEADKGLKTKIEIRLDAPENFNWADWM